MVRSVRPYTTFLGRSSTTPQNAAAPFAIASETRWISVWESMRKGVHALLFDPLRHRGRRCSHRRQGLFLAFALMLQCMDKPDATEPCLKSNPDERCGEPKRRRGRRVGLNLGWGWLHSSAISCWRSTKFLMRGARLEKKQLLPDAVLWQESCHQNSRGLPK
jgi:hypothetical protein